ncbi:MAG TPA: hypothetical protein VN677_13925 [Gemmatimonadaceae bacterium]|jgi:hypothetical protein|nr:hypothetical protein [Gemmatimonadaceae bacterium]
MHAQSIGRRAAVCAFLLAACLVTGTTARAQIVPAGNPVAFGTDSLYAKIFLAIGDGASPAFPIRGVHLLLIAANGDTTRLATDGAGAAAAYVAPGDYELESRDPVNWRGIDYYWKMRLSVAPDMTDLVLSVANAAPPIVPSLASRGPRGDLGSAVTNASRVTSLSDRPVRTNRRTIEWPRGVHWDVFEQYFSPAAVVGKDLPLPKSLKVLVFDQPSETRQLDAFPDDWRDIPDSALVALLQKATRTRP